jgi:GH15 family glucan-1,4-alpha-glucosidase
VPYHPIENYGIVGDLHTVALIAENASIDFMCFPRFDSPTIFAALLDDNKGGCFKIHPMLDRVRHKQLYLPDSNVLVSRFLSEQGVAEVSDFMSVEGVGDPHTLVRRARTVRGEVKFRMLCAPRFDYARAHHVIERINDGVIFTSRGRDETALRLRATVPIQVVNGEAVAEFTLAAGSSADFVLEPARPDGASP